MRILAIETSCDETAAALVTRDKEASFVTIEKSVVASQVDLHKKYGGVYPEVASREHIRTLLPVISEALGLVPETGRQLPHFDWRDIDALAVTQGPGLIGSLLIGVQTVATLSYVTKTPLIPVNHLSGHIYASFIQHAPDTAVPRFPLMALVVSGGHTMLVLMRDHHEYELLGQTRDDAAGEAFDKVAKLLGLGYPGGPEIGRMALQGDRHAYDLPIGLEHEKTFDFSFSGLKTAVLRLVQQQSQPLTQEIKANIAASFERAVIEALLFKTSKALDTFAVRHFVIGGGVSANRYLRERFATFLAHRVPSVELFIAPPELCTDNAAVIGASAAFMADKITDPLAVEAFARFPLVTRG